MEVESRRVGFVVVAGALAVSGLAVALSGPDLGPFAGYVAVAGSLAAGLVAGIPAASTEEGFYNGTFASLVAMGLAIAGSLARSALSGGDVLLQAAGILILAVWFGSFFGFYALVLGCVAAGTVWGRARLV
jgi:hypothetical protein